MVDRINKDELYRISGWASWECENLIRNLEDLGLTIVSIKQLETNNLFCNLCEDDGK